MQAYNDSFAHIYNIRWGFFSEKAAPTILDFFKKQAIHKDDGKILDLCCGTGHLSESMLKNGYQVTGLDLSPDMLDIAIEKNQRFIDAGRAKFVEGDAADFEMDESYDLVVSTFDALNHLESFDALFSCFECVYDVTEEDGWFIFDLNTLKGIRRWSGINVDIDDDLLVITRGAVDEFNEVGYSQITAFLKEDDGRFTKVEETIYNTIYDLQKVEQALKEVGWKTVKYVLPENFEIEIDEPEEFGRVFLLAQK
ncbi:MAG: class I SAM-dependent methyltransferase [Anaerolineales bacterium]|nr:class I SAM-dependent methyltransferase [Anaerolineales bacterium]